MSNNVFSKVAGVEKVSMIDMRGYVSCVLFSNKCSGYVCPYCYNIDLWHGRLPELDPQGIKDYLLSRKNVIDYVVFSGGECTMYPQYLIDSARWCKENGFKVKIDTNGSNPNIIMQMYDDGLIDYLALDYKYPDLPNEYLKFHSNSMLRWNMENLLEFLISEGKAFETRTTIHPEITDEHKANLILKELEKWGYKGTHYFQFFNECPETLGNVNQHPRRFRTEDLIETSFKVEFRNLKNNDKRHG